MIDAFAHHTQVHTQQMTMGSTTVFVFASMALALALSVIMWKRRKKD